MNTLLLLGLLSVPPQNESLGTLLFTPHERHVIDQQGSAIPQQGRLERNGKILRLWTQDRAYEPHFFAPTSNERIPIKNRKIGKNPGQNRSHTEKNLQKKVDAPS
ncbi:hypothetical protein KSF73_02250 [Burkholderiaceae bacterium DAT-1]|nr:hypothetical protein [Burkholderiaceae bacterium DAT-1]